VLTGLPPLLSGNTRLLILGSFPGAASLAAQQYYGHPQNSFWKIFQAIWPSSALPTGADSYKIRSEWLLDKGLGLWDVYGACEREGSLDSSIRQPQVNDFSQLRQWCPELQAIAHNGGESFKHARHVSAALACVTSPVAKPGPQDRLCRTAGGAAPMGGSALHEVKSVGVLFHRLPSTSPANASWSFDRKLAAWREVFEQHGLTDKQ
jgi:hypoxanthine-DNA glycosylase